MGWTRNSVAVSVLLVLDEQRKKAGERVVQLRDAKGWTQEDLAREAGVSYKTISRFENGRHEGRGDTIRKIAEALGVDRDTIVGPPPAPLGLGGETQLDRIEKELAAHRQLLERILRLSGEPATSHGLREAADLLGDAAQQENTRPDESGEEPPADSQEG
jgi:transcriptional regulator with XRE-family HTH domain